MATVALDHVARRWVSHFRGSALLVAALRWAVAMVTGIGNDMEASAEAMTMEQMIAMKALNATSFRAAWITERG